MANKTFSRVTKAGGVLSALMAALMLLTSCGETNPASGPNNNEPPTNELLPPVGLPDGPGPIGEGLPPPPVVHDALSWDTIDLIVRTNPRHPEDEQFLGDWRLVAHNIDDQARPLGPSYFGEVGPDGTASLGLPGIMFQLPLEISGYNEAAPGHGCHHHKCGNRPPITDPEPIPQANDNSGVVGEAAGAEGEVAAKVEGDATVAADGEVSADGCGCSCGRHRAHNICDDDICKYDDHKGGCGCGSDNGCHSCKKDCQAFSIFVPPYCYDKAVWMVGPVESAVWDYYRRAARHRGEAWNASQVDCGTWLADLQLLILTDRVSDELDREGLNGDRGFDPEALRLAFQENQQLLVPTRPPICMATNFHTGGTLHEDKPITLPIDLVPGPLFDTRNHNSPHDSPITIGENGIVSNICGIPFDGEGRVYNANSFQAFAPTANFTLDSNDYIGTVSEQNNIFPLLDVTLYNVRLGNGRPLDNDVYTDACALSTMYQFTNRADEDRELSPGTGTTFDDLYGPGVANQAVVYATSDGDKIVDDDDTWVIFHSIGDTRGEEQVIAVELLGHRSQDFRDALHISLNADDDLFLGLRADYDLDDAGVDGELAFFNYTISVWDGSTSHGRDLIGNDISACYEAADVWARQFFVTQDFHHFDTNLNCCFDGKCKIGHTICPLRAAEFAVRSQCFSNSRANSRWQNDQSAFWNISSVKGAEPNVAINPGWLGPNLDFYLYIQKFDEAVFKGPRTVVRTDCHGQLLTAIPTLVEGDRILLKAIDSCCSDYDLVLPCVPEFTGFAGLPGVPYIPQTIGPPPFPGPGPGPVIGPVPPGLIAPAGPIGPGPIGIGPGPVGVGPLSGGPLGPVL